MRKSYSFVENKSCTSDSKEKMCFVFVNKKSGASVCPDSSLYYQFLSFDAAHLSFGYRALGGKSFRVLKLQTILILHRERLGLHYLQQVQLNIMGDCTVLHIVYMFLFYGYNYISVTWWGVSCPVHVRFFLCSLSFCICYDFFIFYFFISTDL